MSSNFHLSIIAVVALVVASVSGLPNGGRIVGGDDATRAQFPYQASLQWSFGGAHICGGSLLNDRFILTAAHCVVVGNGIETYPPHYFQVRLGSILYMAGGKLLQLKRIIVNKSYGDFLNDVALLELEKPLQFTNNIKPIELANAEVPAGAVIIVSGWGRLYTNGPIPFRLQWTTLKAISKDQCNNEIGMNEDSIICLAHEKDNGVCSGDSGGPATYKGKLVGVANFVYGGCGTSKPDGYAKVFYHLEWILENMVPSS